jgi:hypothetical protein
MPGNIITVIIKTTIGSDPITINSSNLIAEPQVVKKWNAKMPPRMINITPSNANSIRLARNTLQGSFLGPRQRGLAFNAHNRNPRPAHIRNTVIVENNTIASLGNSFIQVSLFPK